jgi:hypothetical protein
MTLACAAEEEFRAETPLWSAEAVAARLAEAADTLRRLPFPRGGLPSRLRAQWPDIVRSSVEIWIASAQERPRNRPAAPSPQAIDRLDRTLAWLHWLKHDERRIVWARSCGLSWRKIEDLDGRSHTTLRGVYRGAIAAVAKRLNRPEG